MSCTEIYGFDKEGNGYEAGEIHNSWRGGWMIWKILEDRYLPIFRPDHVPPNIPDDKVEGYLGYKPSRLITMTSDKDSKEIWDLFGNEKVSLTDRIVLGSTLDKIIVEKKDMPKLIEAFNNFEGETSLKEQAAIIQKMYDDEDCIAVAWNQTSVSTFWGCGDYDEETDTSTPYNLFKNDEHWSLFDELETA